MAQEWIIDSPMEDAQAEQLVNQLEGYDRVVIRTPDLGGAVVQLLLCFTRRGEVVVEADSPGLKCLFENPQPA